MLTRHHLSEEARASGRLVELYGGRNPHTGEAARRGLAREIAIARLLLQPGPRLDIVTFDTLRVGIVARLFGHRVYYTEHSNGGPHIWARHNGARGPRVALRHVDWAFTVLTANAVVFPSAAAVELFRSRNRYLPRLVARKVRVFYNGVESPEPVTAAHDAVESLGLGLLCVSAEVPDKAIPRMVRWLEAATSAAPLPGENRLTIVGAPGSDTPDVLAEVRSAHRWKIHRLGELPHEEVMKQFDQHDALIHLPRAAVFDLVVLEAMARAVPVLSTKVGGNVEALGESYPYYVNSPEDLKQALAGIKEEGRAIGEALRSRLQERFTLEDMVRRYLRPGE